MFVRAKRQVFVSDKPETTSTKDKKRKKSKSKEKERREKKLQWFALYWLRFWPKTKVLDGRGLFDSDVFKNSVRYICIVHEVRNKFVDCKTPSLYGWNPRTIPLTKYPHYSLT